MLPNKSWPDDVQRMLQRGQIWHGDQTHADMGTGKASSGYFALDQLLGGGLSYGVLQEVQLPAPFCGETRVLQAPLQGAVQAQQPIFWMNPPATPCVAGLDAAPSPHIVCTELTDEELSWTVRQVIAQVSAGILVIWHPAPSVNMVRQWQRALTGAPLFILVFSLYMSSEARPYQTRLKLHVQNQQVSWQVLKRAGGWPTQSRWMPLQRW